MDDSAEPVSPAVEQQTVIGAGGLPIAVYERNRGAAQTVLLVHGYPDNHSVWDPVAEILAERFHVVTYDVRGAGASGVPDGTRGYRLDRLTDDVAAVIAATLPDDRRVHLVGHDWGSVQGWHFAGDARVAARIASFTSMSGPQLDAVGDFLRRRGTAPPSVATATYQAAKSWYVGMFQLPALAPAFWRSPLGRRAWPRVLEQVEGVPAERLPDADALTRTQADGANGVGLYRANVPAAMRSPRPPHTSVPVQLVVAEKDRYVSPAMALCVAPLADELVVVRVDGGHWLPLTRPERVAELITEHIDRQDRP